MNESYQPIPSFRAEAVTGLPGRPVAVPAPLVASTGLIAPGSVVSPVLAAPAYSAKVARSIIDNQVTVQPILLGGTWGLDLADESCELCGGNFPRIGDASMYLGRYGDPMFLHLGCEKQVEDWLGE